MAPDPSELYRGKASRAPRNLVATSNLIEFDAEPDKPYQFQINETLILSWWRWVDGCHWVDATGEYDLCLDSKAMTYSFTSRIAEKARFGALMISGFWPQSVRLEG